MTHLIDTAVAIHFRDRNRLVMQRVYALERRPLLSILSIVELEGGIARDPGLANERRRLLDALLGRFQTLDLTHDVATAYGCIVTVCGFSRRKVIDRLIAATAIVHELTLITTNGADFADIPDLCLEVWPAQ